MKKIISHLERNVTKYLIGAICGYIAFFSFLNFLKFNNFRYNGLDLAIINQMLYNSSLGNFFASTIHPPTYLKDHFSPFIFFLMIPYSIWGHPVMLLILQNIALALCALPLYWISKLHFSKIVSLSIALMWLFNPQVQSLSMFEFSFLPFSLVFLLLAFLFYSKNNFGAYLVAILLALLSREDVALVVFMFGILALIEKKPIRWSGVSCILGLLYFFSAIRLINIFGQGGEYKFFIYYSWLGENVPQIVTYVLKHPLTFLARFFHIGNIEMILGFLLPFAFLPLLQPRYLLLLAPAYAQIFFGIAGPSGLILKTQYASLFLPTLFIAFVFALKKIRRTHSEHYLWKLLVREKLGVLIIIIAVIYGDVMIGPVYGALKHNFSSYKNAYQKQKQEIVRSLPQDVAVAASYDVLPHISSRSLVYGMNYFFIGLEQFGRRNYVLPDDTEYLLINLSDFISYELQYRDSPLYRNNFLSGDDRMRERMEKDNFGIIKIFDDMVLFQKNTFSDIFLYRVHDAIPNIQTKKNILLSRQLTFLGHNTLKTSLELFWGVKEDIAENYFIRFFFKERTGKIVYEKLFPLGAGIYPTHEWKKGQILQTNYWLSDRTQDINLDISFAIIKIAEGAIFLESDLSVKNVISKSKTIGEIIGPLK